MGRYPKYGFPSRADATTEFLTISHLKYLVPLFASIGGGVEPVVPEFIERIAPHKLVVELSVGV